MVSVVGVVAISGIIYFGLYLFRSIRGGSVFDHPFLSRAFHLWETSGIRPNLPKYLADSFSDFLERRNEFWTTYGQVIIAALVIIVLTLLLLTKTISAEAGLPILSGISGFAVAKGVSAGRSSSAGPEDRG
jgi:quinol-cytochrome oxidoreductase complex cytochrome b subunit